MSVIETHIVWALILLDKHLTHVSQSNLIHIMYLNKDGSLSLSLAVGQISLTIFIHGVLDRILQLETDLSTNPQCQTLPILQNFKNDEKPMAFPRGK